MADLPEQNTLNNKEEKYVSRTWFIVIITGLCAILAFIGNNVYNRIDVVESNYRNDIKSVNERYQADHDKITKIEDLKAMIQNDHDNLLKLEERIK